MRAKLVLILLLVLLLSAQFVSAAKKKARKSRKPRARPAKSSPKRPDKELYCSACIAVIKEALKILKNRRSETDVFDALDGICKPEHFYVYEFPPPEMREGCEAFIAGWERVVEKNLMNRTSEEQAIKTVCHDISLACYNTNPADAPKFDDKVMIDGQPVDVRKGDDKKDL